MDLSPAEARRRLAASRHAILATVRPDGSPHLVPVVFALVHEVVYSAVDHKPKRSAQLQRLINLRHEPRCALLVDHYDDDWTRLWWVRAEGRAAILEAPEVEPHGRAALLERYAAYREHPPAGPYLRVEIAHVSGWAAS